MKKKLGVLCSHPIQYYSALFRFLAGIPDLDLRVFYAHRPSPEQQGAGFGVPFSWDVDLVSGYPCVWLKNVASRPNLTGFGGCDTPEIAEIIYRERFDAFLVLGWHKKSLWQAMRACWRSKTPVMVRGDSHLHVTTPWWKRALKEGIYPHFVRKFSACLAVGRWSAEYFAHYGARKVIASPHFVDNQWFAAKAGQWRPEREEIRRVWNITPGSTVFLFAGKFEEKKRPMDILRALRELLRQGVLKEKVHVLMAGDGALKERSFDFARAHSLPVSFTGFLNQTEMPKAYAVSDVLVLPSDGRETWGLVVNEAMACGLPAIVSDQVGCGPDLIEEGRTGFTFACGSITALAEGMRRATAPAFTVNQGGNARRRVGQYTVDQAAVGVLRALNAEQNGP